MNTPGNLAQLVDGLISLINSLIPLVFAVTLLVIVWKVIDVWILNVGDSGKVEEGKRVIGIGVIALVVMSGLWGILALLRSSLIGI